MKEPIENKLGFWFIDEKEFSGMLSFSQEKGIRVTIISAEIAFGFHKMQRLPIITGVLENGEPITLVNCLIFHSNMSMRSLTDESKTYVEKANIRAEYMIEGMLYETKDEIKFRSLLGRYTDLDEWVDVSGFDFDLKYSEESDYDYLVKYKSPEPITYQVNNDLEVGVGFITQGPRQSMVQKEVQIKQSCYLKITSSNEPKNFSDIFDHLRWLTLLLQIGSQRKTYPIEIIGIIDKKDNTDQKFNKEVNIYYQPIESIREVSSLIPPFFNFTFKELNQSIIDYWFNNYSKIKTIVDDRSTLFLHDRLFIETKFLNILQALEIIHNINMDSRCLKKSLFKEIREKLLSQIPEKYKGLFEHKIGRLNYISFQDKLIQLIKTKEVAFSKVIYNIDSFCKRVTRTRNMIVHPSNDQKPLTNQEIAYSIELFTILFDAYLLEIIGFSEEKVRSSTDKRIKDYISWGTVFNK